MGKKRQAADGHVEGKKHKKQRKEEKHDDAVKEPKAKEDSVTIFDATNS